MVEKHGLLAQLVEQVTLNHSVRGSIPDSHQSSTEASEVLVRHLIVFGSSLGFLRSAQNSLIASDSGALQAQNQCVLPVGMSLKASSVFWRAIGSLIAAIEFGSDNIVSKGIALAIKNPCA